MDIYPKAKWNSSGHTTARPNPLLSDPRGLYVDVDQTVYIAECSNHCIVAWRFGEGNGRVAAGGQGKGNGAHQLSYPTDVIVDKKSDSLIICDSGNNRVVRWPRQNGANGQIIISDIACWGLTMDEKGSVYVTDVDRHEVRRYGIGEYHGTIVAGGNGRGVGLNQLNWPYYIFVDREHSVFVSDGWNHRVMKWPVDAQEGIVVAGNQGQGGSLAQLDYPLGVVVDQLGTVYVTDRDNHRIIRWPKEARQGNVISGENGNRVQANQLYSPRGLSFDQYGNLYVAEGVNKVVQRFTIETSSKLMGPTHE